MRKEELELKRRELEELEKYEKELNSRINKVYNFTNIIIMIILLTCIIYQTCYIRDSIDLNGWTFGAEINEDDYKDDENGPYNLDDNTQAGDATENDGIANNNGINVNKRTNTEINNGGMNINSEDNSSNTNVDYNGNNDNTIITQPVTPEEIKEIKLFQESSNNISQSVKEEFSTLNNLEIFKNDEYFNEKLLYPGEKGNYKFYIENYTLKNIGYKLTFSLENDKNANIMYKLKRNGQYVVGKENEYANYTQLTQIGLKLKAKTGDMYTLEWKWVEASNDNQTTNPVTRGKYKLSIIGEVE